MESLWGEEFIIPSTPKKAKKIIDKIKNPESSDNIIKVKKSSSKKSITEKLQFITENVIKILGRYKDNTVVITTREQLKSYIDEAIANNIISIDTETNNSLDPLTCKLMGPCIYTPGQKNAYIPLNHVDPITRERLPNQLTEADIAEEFNRLRSCFIIMHNGKFDYQVIRCTTDVDLHIDWDTMIGAKILDENEEAGLKYQYKSKIDPTVEKYSIDHLFEDVEYAVVDPEVFALYAATDAYMTYKLYMYQLEQFSLPMHRNLYNLFKNIEMPIVLVAANMELEGVAIDTDYAERLSAKYHKKLDVIDAKIAEELNQYTDIINEWRKSPDALAKPKKKSGDGEGKSKAEQLEDPVNVASPTQLAILLYDIIKVGEIDKKKPRGTGEDILEKIKLPICETILERRSIMKLIDTYIDKLPICLSPSDNRLHAHSNQLGAGTGRFSSSDPNLQNIPSSNKEIRLLFRAKENHVLVGSDFS